MVGVWRGERKGGWWKGGKKVERKDFCGILSGWVRLIGSSSVESGNPFCIGIAGDATRSPFSIAGLVGRQALHPLIRLAV